MRADFAVIKNNESLNAAFTTTTGTITISYGDFNSETSNTPSHTFTDTPPYLLNVKDIDNTTLTGIAISGNTLTALDVSRYKNLDTVVANDNSLNRRLMGRLFRQLDEKGVSNGSINLNSNITSDDILTADYTSYNNLISKGWDIQGYLWSPSEITTSVWLDANDSDTITIATGVSQWDDKSGNGNHMTQGTGGNQPSYIENDSLVNDKPSVFSADSVSQYLAASSTAPSVQRAYFVCYFGDGTTGTYSDHNAIFSATDGSVRLTGRVGETDAWDGTAGGMDAKNFDDFGGTPGEIYINGSTTDAFSSNPQLPMPTTLWKISSSSSHDKEWRVLSNGGASWASWYGGLSEIILTDGTEDLATQQKIEGYLAHKWGLSSSLPSGHPYKILPP